MYTDFALISAVLAVLVLSRAEATRDVSLERIDGLIALRPAERKTLEKARNWFQKEGAKENVAELVELLLSAIEVPPPEDDMCQRRYHEVVEPLQVHERALPWSLKGFVKTQVRRYNDACLKQLNADYEETLAEIDPRLLDKIETFVDIVKLREKMMSKTSEAYQRRRLDSELRRKFNYENYDRICVTYVTKMKGVFEPGFPQSIGSTKDAYAKLTKPKSVYDLCKAFLRHEELFGRVGEEVPYEFLGRMRIGE